MNEQKQPLSETPVKEVNINKGRRRLSKAALATPVIASLAARPAMACSVSGFISGNTSPGRQPPTCEGYGCTPGYWKNHPAVWSMVTPYNAGYCSKWQNKNFCSEWTVGGTTLGNILPTTCANPFGFSTNTYLLDILNKGVTGDDVTQYADLCHYIAAILNAASSIAYGSTVEEIQNGLCIAAGKGEVNWYTTVLLAGLNERGCMYDAHGGCEKDFVLNTATPPQCIPACPVGYEFDSVSMKCVPIGTKTTS